MIALVTGVGGRIGGPCILSLLEQNENAIDICNLSIDFGDTTQTGAQLVIKNIGDYALVLEMVRIKCIATLLQFAASAAVQEYSGRHILYCLSNVATTCTIIRVATGGAVCNFVFSSSAAVYGAMGDALVTEDHPTDPISRYGMFKLMAERMLVDVGAAGGPRYAILRYFNVAGADPRGRAGQSTPRATHLIKVACRAVFNSNRTSRVFGMDYPAKDGTCIRDYIHVSDLARAHMCALDCLESGGKQDIFNCGYGNGSSVLDVINAVEQAAGINLIWSFEGRRAGDAPSAEASNEKIKRTLGWSPRFEDVSEIVTHALAWEERLWRRSASAKNQAAQTNDTC